MSSQPKQPETDNLAEWNNEMFLKHPTPYGGLAGKVEAKRAKEICKQIRKYKTSDEFTLLEIGCEAGKLLEHFSGTFPTAKLYGYDFSTEALKEAEKLLGDKVKELKFADLTDQTLTADIPNLEFIVCSETLEHIPEVEKAAATMARITNPSQYVIITVPYEKLKNQIKNVLNKLKIFDVVLQGIEKEFSEWHVQDFSKEDLYNLFGNDFDILEYKKIMGLHHMIVMRRKA